ARRKDDRVGERRRRRAPLGRRRLAAEPPGATRLPRRPVPHPLRAGNRRRAGGPLTVFARLQHSRTRCGDFGAKAAKAERPQREIFTGGAADTVVGTPATRIVRTPKPFAAFAPLRLRFKKRDDRLNAGVL